MRFKQTIRVKIRNLMWARWAFVRLLMLLQAILMLMQITLEIRSAQLLCTLTRNHQTHFVAEESRRWAYLVALKLMANIQTAMKTPWINHIFSGCCKHSRAQFSTDADRQLKRVHFVLISSRYEFNSFDFEGSWWNVSMHTLKFTQGKSERKSFLFHAFRKGHCF